MMKREYTDAVYDKLIKTIDEINESDFSWITDALGDLWMTFEHWLGVLKSENYLTKIDEYHRKVLDQHNTTEKDLKRIFKAVEKTDSEKAKSANETKDAADGLKDYIVKMTEMLSLNSCFSADEIKARAVTIKIELDNAKEKMNDQFDIQLTEKEKRVAEKAAKELIGDVLGMLVNIGSFVGKAYAGDIPGMLSSGWKFIDGFFTMCEDICAVAEVGIGVGLYKLSWTDNRGRYISVEEAGRRRQMEGLASELDDMGLEKLADVVRSIGVIADAYSLFSGITGAVGDIKTISKVVTSDVLTTGTKIQILISEYVPGLFGIGHMDYGDGTIGKIKNSTGYISTAKNVWEFIDILTDPDKSVMDYFFNNNDILGIPKDEYDMIDDENEWLESIMTSKGITVGSGT